MDNNSHFYVMFLNTSNMPRNESKKTGSLGIACTCFKYDDYKKGNNIMILFF